MTRVIAVGMFDSVHFARWLEQFQHQRIEFLLFPSSPHRRLHPKLSALLTAELPATYSLVRFTRFAGLPLWVLDKILNNALRGWLLRVTAWRFKPQFVHALEIQNAGYVSMAALEKSKPTDLKLIVTNYGSDIFWFRKFPSHLAKIERLLAITDQYASECERDVRLARELQFEGQVMSVRPNAGGFSNEILRKTLRPITHRPVIAIKGYNGWAGRAHLAIEALKVLKHRLLDYEIIFFSSNTSTVTRARRCAKETGLKITAYAKGALSHSEMLNLFGRSTLYLGLSVSDGISTSMLEAMAMGAIPVQTATACCDEWFDETGVKVQDLSVAAVADAILEGIELAKDPSNRITNRETIRSKASEDYVRDAALEFYR
ncbi:MAG: glycosyltransferase family 4 protein [Aquiluna sp.]